MFPSLFDSCDGLPFSTGAVVVDTSTDRLVVVRAALPIVPRNENPNRASRRPPE
jgi:hypothetical protein